MLTSEQKSYVLHASAIAIGGTDYAGMDDEHYAKHTGRSLDALRSWEAMPEVAAAITQTIAECNHSADYFKTVTRHRVLEEMWEQYRKAKGSDKRQYLAMLLDQTKDADISADAVDHTSMSDDELIASMVARGIAPTGMTLEELAALGDKAAKKGAKRV